MNFKLTPLLLAFSCSAFGAESKLLRCVSNADVRGWKGFGTNEALNFQATVLALDRIHAARVTGILTADKIVIM